MRTESVARAVQQRGVVPPELPPSPDLVASDTITAGRCDLSLWPKQTVALRTSATEVLYGGAAGPGKSHLLRVAGITWAAEIPGLQVYLFRRQSPDLVKNHIQGPHGFRVLLAGWVASGHCQIVDNEIRFWNGSRIYLCHCKDPDDIYNYQGAEFHVLLIDELTHFTDEMYRFLRSRVRAPGLKLPAKYAGLFPRIICGSNPGNIGHGWVKAAWIDLLQPFEVRRMERSEGEMLRQFIPALLEDNPSMAVDDPGYEGRLYGMGSDSLVRSMRFGDWDTIEGAFFDTWRRSLHVLPPFVWPKHWTRIVSHDWGSARPSSTGFWVVAGEDFVTPDLERRRVLIPKGAMIRVGELYTTVKPGSNKGIKKKAEAIARMILKAAPPSFVKNQKGRVVLAVDDAVADPSCWIENGGESIAERMANEGVDFRQADNKRVPGWNQLTGRFEGEDDRPMIYCFSTCLDSIRTIPVLQHDEHKIEDLNTKQEDHAADDWRYAGQARPWTRVQPSDTPAKRDRVAEAMAAKRHGKLGVEGWRVQ
jgi:hypothetical protein